MQPPQDTKPELWHRFFGASANNRAWELAESPADQIKGVELLNAAHAAAWHWQQIGTELNRMRALMLLAEAHAKTGLGSSALAYADEMRAYFLGVSETPDWELAFVHVIHAHAASAAQAKALHAQSYALADQAIKVIADEEDRAIVLKVFQHVPVP